MGTASGMISAARSLLGTVESPPGSNHNFITTWYGFDGAWCDMAVSSEAGHSDNLAAMIGKFAYTVAHATAFKNHGRWHYGLGGIRPGDVVFFDWGGSGSISKIDHVGLVEAVHSNGTITTLEGNTSNTFARRVRRSGVVGYGRPAYGDAAPMPSTDGMLRVGSVRSPSRRSRRTSASSRTACRAVAPPRRWRPASTPARSDLRAGGPRSTVAHPARARQPGSTASMAVRTASDSGSIRGRNRATTWPCGAMRNFSKFQETSPASPSASGVRVRTA